MCKDADVTVVLYNQHKVKANYAFKKGELKDKDIDVNGKALDFAASPAVACDRLYLRSQSRLYCIGERKLTPLAGRNPARFPAQLSRPAEAQLAKLSSQRGFAM